MIIFLITRYFEIWEREKIKLKRNYKNCKKL